MTETQINASPVIDYIKPFISNGISNVNSSVRKQIYQKPDSSNKTMKPLSALETKECNVTPGKYSVLGQNLISDINDRPVHHSMISENSHISDCIEKIVPFRTLDLYVQESTRFSKQINTTISREPVRLCTLDVTSMYNQMCEISNDLKFPKRSKLRLRCLDETGSVINDARPNLPNVTQITDDDPPTIAGVGDNASQSKANTNYKAESIEPIFQNDDLFTDYDSDNDNFEAELQQWQQSSVDLLSQTHKK